MHVKYLDKGHLLCIPLERRGAELAAGGVESVLNALDKLSLTSIPCDDISEEDRSVLLKDFEFARNYLHFSMAAKFGFWRQLPHLCVGLSHHYQGVARGVAKLCLQKFDELRRIALRVQQAKQKEKH